MRARSASLVVAGLAASSIACGDGFLDPSREVDGLEFRGSVAVRQSTPLSPNLPGPAIETRVSVRNVSIGLIHRFFDGGCFVERLQAFRQVDGDRRLAWDSDRAGGRDCTDDLAVVTLRPREEARPHNWGFGIDVSEIRDSLPAGRYEIAVWISPGSAPLRLGAGAVDLP